MAISSLPGKIVHRWQPRGLHGTGRVGPRREKGSCGERSLVRRRLLLWMAHGPSPARHPPALSAWLRRVWESTVLSDHGLRVRCLLTGVPPQVSPLGACGLASLEAARDPTGRQAASQPGSQASGQKRQRQQTLRKSVQPNPFKSLAIINSSARNDY
ncbi:hypothetical protein NDU88_003359 [Pleurodeles waltl]|uniref:Uncharacterized protein n=1 Tax=Pleurodeles waltl TaxID=8319 RepID=A0AAV7TR19_PLEWA|nr:hypothetical protein NDU88_003359 [Pleurodeles waltl]